MNMQDLFAAHLGYGQKSGASLVTPPKKQSPRAPKEVEEHLSHQNDTGWLLCGGDDHLSNQIIRELFQDTLQSKSLKVFARALPRYTKENGVDVMHSQLSLLSAHTLTALSMEACQQGMMDASVAHVVGSHEHVQGLAIALPRSRTDTTPLDLTKVLHPSAPLCRLELEHVHLTSECLLILLRRHGSRLTYLALRHCTVQDCSSLMVSLLPHSIQILDLSHNTWVTDQWLDELIKQHVYHLKHVNVAECPFVSKQVLTHLNFELRGSPLISTKR